MLPSVQLPSIAFSHSSNALLLSYYVFCTYRFWRLFMLSSFPVRNIAFSHSSNVISYLYIPFLWSIYAPQCSIPQYSMKPLL